MEGVSGVVQVTDVGVEPDSDYEMFRRVLTEEVNAAVEGALQAGATDVLVEEHHGARGFRNILLDRLHPRARLIRGWPRPRGGVTGLDGSMAAALFIGYHAREGTPNAVLAHTFLANVIADFTINGRSVGEGEFNALVAGSYGVPVVLVTGDDVVVEQMRLFLGNVEGVEVKHALSNNAAIVLPPEVTTARIRAAAERAVRRRAEFAAAHMDTPYRAEFRYKAIWHEKIQKIAQANPEITFTAPDRLARSCQNANELIDFYMKALDIGMSSSPRLRP